MLLLKEVPGFEECRAHMVKVAADEQMFLSAWTSVIFETVSLHHSHQSFKVTDVS